ncbi:glycosyltransferase family 2 protein [Paraglaciecola arctica]|uniref:glycosyltransferase family 2 protein n=1 Tax=Paraglaciecola arctica TaxID=1128911 RepID=UPI001C0670D6|nr:glycosyltransferase family 2 protein [Paraglaciecola arctica]MBU3002092.1 glycosyltransferase family 2 protein [Paraglaciecola arctica]
MSVLVSVIVPNYNHLGFLPKRLQTIAQQTYPHLEIILLDDASSDGSAAVLEAFAQSEPRVTKFIRNAHNSGGAFQQWIKGARQAKGKYLWIAETDDFSELSFVETLVARLENNPDACLAYCHSTWVDREANSLGVMDIHLPYFEQNYWQQDGCLDGDEINRNFMPFRNVLRNASSAIFRLSSFNQALRHFEPSGPIDDWLFYVQLIKGHQLCFVAQELNYCGLHEANFSRSLTSQSYFKNSRQRLKLMRKILALYPQQSHNVHAALKVLWGNRFKYKAVDKLIDSHTDMGRYGLYGFNDLSKYFVSRCNKKPHVILDKKVVDSSYTSIPLSKVDPSSLFQLDTVIIMSIFYRTQMVKVLKSYNYAGNVVFLDSI